MYVESYDTVGIILLIILCISIILIAILIIYFIYQRKNVNESNKKSEVKLGSSSDDGYKFYDETSKKKAPAEPAKDVHSEVKNNIKRAESRDRGIGMNVFQGEAVDLYIYEHNCLVWKCILCDCENSMDEIICISCKEGRRK